MLLAWVTGRNLVSSLYGILNADNTKISNKSNIGIKSQVIQPKSIWSDYFKKTDKKTTFVHKEESILSKMCTNLKKAVKESNFTNAVLLFLHIKSDKRYQNLSFEEKQRLNALLKKYNFDINNLEDSIEKIDSWLKNINMKKKDRNFATAQKEAAKFSMAHNYSKIANKRYFSDKMKEKIESALQDDNNLTLAFLEYASFGLDANNKAEFIGNSAKNAVSARKEANKYLEELIKENPTTKENIEKLYELNMNSSMSVNDMLLKLLETIDCDEKIKLKMKKTINKIKDNIPKEFHTYLEELKKSDAWEYINNFQKAMKEDAFKEMVRAEKKLTEQKKEVEKKENELKIKKNKLEEKEYKAKLATKAADTLIQNIKYKTNPMTISENQKDNILKNNNINIYNKYKNAKQELKIAKDIEYEAASALRISQVFLDIDKRNQEFTINRYQILS